MHSPESGIEVDMTMLRLFFSGRKGSESHVLRPIMTVWPVVIALNLFRSSERCHRRLLARPMPLFSSIATMMEIMTLH